MINSLKVTFLAFENIVMSHRFDLRSILLILLNRKETFLKQIDEHYPKFFGFLEKQLKDNTSQDFLVGNSYTIADFAFLGAYGSAVNHPLRKKEAFPVLDNYPTLKAYWAKLWDAQKEYFDNREECSF